MCTVKDCLVATWGRRLGGNYFYAEVFRGSQFEDPAIPRGVGYLMDFEVDLAARAFPGCRVLLS